MCKVPCVTCGIEILASTSERNSGKCAPCASGRREAVEASKKRYQEERETAARLTREREPIEKLRLSGYPVTFEDYFSLDNPVSEIFLAIADTDFDQLSDESKLVYLICCADGEIVNGGIDQLFTNTLGNHGIEILACLKTVNAIEHYRILEKSFKWFPDSKPSKDRSERFEQIEKFEDNDEYLLEEDKLSKEFCAKSEELSKLIEDYILTNKTSLIKR